MLTDESWLTTVIGNVAGLLMRAVDGLQNPVIPEATPIQSNVDFLQAVNAVLEREQVPESMLPDLLQEFVERAWCYLFSNSNVS